MIVELKQRNPRFGCPQIALITRRTFGVEIDKDVVRRVLARHYRPEPGGGGPSWLTFIGHMKNGLWSVDLFRCESITLKTHWVLVVMDQFSHRIIGFGTHAGDVDGIALCRMFNHCAPQKLRARSRGLRFETVHRVFAEHRTEGDVRPGRHVADAGR